MDTLPIESALILACPSCAMDNPVFLALSMLAGAVPCNYWLLKPYTRHVRTWGVTVPIFTLLGAGIGALWEWQVDDTWQPPHQDECQQEQA